MLHCYLLAALLLLTTPRLAHAQVRIGTTVLNTSAAADSSSTNDLLPPCFSKTQHDGLTAGNTTPAVAGLVIYQQEQYMSLLFA